MFSALMFVNHHVVATSLTRQLSESALKVKGFSPTVFHKNQCIYFFQAEEINEEIRPT